MKYDSSALHTPSTLQGDCWWSTINWVQAVDRLYHSQHNKDGGAGRSVTHGIDRRGHYPTAQSTTIISWTKRKTTTTQTKLIPSVIRNSKRVSIIIILTIKSFVQNLRVQRAKWVPTCFLTKQVWTPLRRPLNSTLELFNTNSDSKLSSYSNAQNTFTNTNSYT